VRVDERRVRVDERPVRVAERPVRAAERPWVALPAKSRSQPRGSRLTRVPRLRSAVEDCSKRRRSQRCPATGGLPLDVAIWGALAGVLVVVAAVGWFALRAGGRLGNPTQRTTYETLHTASQAAPGLRGGLTRESARGAVPHLRRLLGGGVVLADRNGLLAVNDVDTSHSALLEGPLHVAITTGKAQMLSARELTCGDSLCPLQGGVAVPLRVDGEVVGALGTLATTSSTTLARLATEVARFVSTQLELAELERERSRADQAELRFLRAQIAPHFVYNALTAIESFIRTDPERARELLVGFADFTRYSFRSHGQWVTLAEELRLVDTYLDLERARFGDRLDVSMRVAPEVLSVMLPSLVLQPLVENAVRHGLEPSERPGTLAIVITDAGEEAMVRIEDDGVGADPVRLLRVLSGSDPSDAVGLHNVDERLRAVFGEDHGLRIRSSPGTGTTVTLRIPKRRPVVARD
jgi:two-component system LytT family sensor kinase